MSVFGSIRVGSRDAFSTARGSSVLDVDGGITYKRTAVADANYTILLTDHLIGYTSLSAPRTSVRLPRVTSVTYGSAATMS